MILKKFKRKFKYKSIVITFLLDLYKNSLTPMGRHLVNLGLIFCLMGTVLFSGTFLLYSLVLFFISLFAFSPIIQYLLKPRLYLDITSPGRCAAGSVISQKVQIKNLSKKNGYFIYVRESQISPGLSLNAPEGMLIPLLKSGEEVSFTLDLNAEKRGSYSLEKVRLESAFPLGVWKTGVTLSRHRNLLVYPFFNPLSAMYIPAGRKLQPGGIALASNIGESMEFLGTREFRTGDNPKHIHWKSWARLNKPIVKEFQEEYFTRIALFIDSYTPDDSDEVHLKAFESSLSLAASISDYLERQEYIIDIIAAGPDIFYLQAGRSLACLDQILDILACLNPCPEKPYSLVEPHLMEEMSKICTLIVLLLDWDEQRRDFLYRLKSMGIDMKIYLVTDKEPPLEILNHQEGLGPVVITNSQEIQKGFEQL